MKRKIDFSENEYLSIRSEMIERIKLLNSQSFTALTTIISFWVAGFTFNIALMSNENRLMNELISLSKMRQLI